jgi:chromosome segregation ATPase
MKENLEAAKRAGAEMRFDTEQLEEQNAELLRLNMAQVTTIDEQKATIEGAQQNLETAKSELSAAQANLGLELQLKELQERQSVEQKRLIAQQQAQLREHEAYIAQCQSCLASVFTSHQELIQNLQLSLEVQTKTVNQILQNVHSIANGEQKLTDALGWAQGRIAEAQAKLTAVINISAEVTDREKCKELIENGEFAQKAQVMHQAAQEAHQLMNELSTGLTTRILEAQQAIAANRKQAEVQLRTLTSQQQKTKHDLRNANAQIKKRQQEIARLDAEHEAALKRVGKTNTAQIQTLEAEIAREKQSLDALAKEKGSLARNLQRARRTCRELQEKVNSLSLSNDTLQKQCQMQEQTLKEQQETIESQRQSLETVQTSLEHLQLQAQSSGWLQTAAAVVGGALGMALLR